MSYVRVSFTMAVILVTSFAVNAVTLTTTDLTTITTPATTTEFSTPESTPIITTTTSETTTTVITTPPQTTSSTTSPFITTTSVSSSSPATTSATTTTSFHASSQPSDSDTTLAFNETLELTSNATTTTTSSSTPLPTTTTSGVSTTTADTSTHPPNWENMYYTLSFTLPIDAAFDADLENSSSPLYKAFKDAVEILVDNSFTGCPGYRRGRSVVTGFSNGSIIAEYDTQFDGETVYNDPYSVIQYINSTVVDTLAQSQLVVNKTNYNISSELTTTMRKELDDQESELLKDPCEVGGNKLCDPCTSCIPGNKDQKTSPYCANKCTKSQHLYCIVLEQQNSTDWKTNCVCEPNYLPVGNECVDQAIIIGVSVGVGAAILIGLIIAVIVLAMRKPKDKYRHSKSSSDPSFGTSVDLRGAHEPLPAVAAADQHDSAINVTKTDAVEAITEQTTFSVIETPHQSGSKPETVAEQTRDEPDIDYGDFNPQLSAVDTSTNYTIRRPTLVTTQ